MARNRNDNLDELEAMPLDEAVVREPLPIGEITELLMQEDNPERAPAPASVRYSSTASSGEAHLRPPTPTALNPSEPTEEEQLLHQLEEARYKRRIRDLKQQLEDANSDLDKDRSIRHTRLTAALPQRSHSEICQPIPPEEMFRPLYGLYSDSLPAFYNRQIDLVETKFNGDM